MVQVSDLHPGSAYRVSADRIPVQLFLNFESYAASLRGAGFCPRTRIREQARSYGFRLAIWCLAGRQEAAPE
jgi:hypothetical protein